jgi:hypothetical protein
MIIGIAAQKYVLDTQVIQAGGRAARRAVGLNV